MLSYKAYDTPAHVVLAHLLDIARGIHYAWYGHRNGFFRVPWLLAHLLGLLHNDHLSVRLAVKVHCRVFLQLLKKHRVVSICHRIVFQPAQVSPPAYILLKRIRASLESTVLAFETLS